MKILSTALVGLFHYFSVKFEFPMLNDALELCIYCKNDGSSKIKETLWYVCFDETVTSTRASDEGLCNRT